LEFEQRLPAQLNAPMLARQQMGRALKEVLLPARLQDVHLAVSELVTNAVLLSRPAEATTIGITIRIDETHVRVTVQQPMRPVHPSGGLLRADDEPMFSEMILDNVTDRWGTDPGPPPNAWFEVDRKRRPRRSA
jgi:two-component sensor histidine kinase